MISDTCVRCGELGRYAGSWLCRKCYRDPARHDEQRAVEAAAWNDRNGMRAMLIERFGWKGGWGRKERA